MKCNVWIGTVVLALLCCAAAQAGIGDVLDACDVGVAGDVEKVTVHDHYTVTEIRVEEVLFGEATGTVSVVTPVGSQSQLACAHNFTAAEEGTSVAVFLNALSAADAQALGLGEGTYYVMSNDQDAGKLKLGQDHAQVTGYISAVAAAGDEKEFKEAVIPALSSSSALVRDFAAEDLARKHGIVESLSGTEVATVVAAYEGMSAHSNAARWATPVVALSGEVEAVFAKVVDGLPGVYASAAVNAAVRYGKVNASEAASSLEEMYPELSQAQKIALVNSFGDMPVAVTASTLSAALEEASGELQDAAVNALAKQIDNQPNSPEAAQAAEALLEAADSVTNAKVAVFKRAKNLPEGETRRKAEALGK